MMALVLGLINRSSSSRLGIHPLPSSIFQRLTSTPLNLGSRYSCPNVGYWQMTWSPGPETASSTRKLAMIDPGVMSTSSALSVHSGVECSAAMRSRRRCEPSNEPYVSCRSGSKSSREGSLERALRSFKDNADAYEPGRVSLEQRLDKEVRLP